MPSYDYECELGHRFEGRSSIARRTVVHLCPECGNDANVIFTLSDPESILATPVNSQTRWADIAPIDPDTGQVFNTPGEAFATGKYAPYEERMKDTDNREYRENYQRREAKRRKDAPKRAYARMQAGDVPAARPAEPETEDTWITGKELNDG